jgi:hypothetical protein
MASTIITTAPVATGTRDGVINNHKNIKQIVVFYNRRSRK